MSGLNRGKPFFGYPLTRTPRRVNSIVVHPPRSKDGLGNILSCFYYIVWFHYHKRREHRFWEFITHYNYNKNVDAAPGIVIAVRIYVWNDRPVIWEVFLRRNSRRKEWNIPNGTAYPETEESPGLMAQGFLIGPAVSQLP